MFMESTNISPRMGGQRTDITLPPQSFAQADDTKETAGKFDDLFISLTDKLSNKLSNAGQDKGSVATVPVSTGIQIDIQSDNQQDGNANESDANILSDGNVISNANISDGNIDNNALASGQLNPFDGGTSGSKSTKKAINDFIPRPARGGDMADIINQVENRSQSSIQKPTGTNHQSKGLAESFEELGISVSKKKLQGENSEIGSDIKGSSKPQAGQKAVAGKFKNVNFSSDNNLHSSSGTVQDKQAIEMKSPSKTAGKPTVAKATAIQNRENQIINNILMNLNADIEITKSNGKSAAGGNAIKNVVEALQNLPAISKFMKIITVDNEILQPADDDVRIESKIIEKLNAGAAKQGDESAANKPVLEIKPILARDINTSNPQNKPNDNISKLAENNAKNNKDNGEENSNSDFSNEKNENTSNNKLVPQGKFIKAINSTIKTEFTVSKTSSGMESTVSDKIINIRPSEFAGKAIQLVKNAQGGVKATARMIMKPASLGTVFVNVSLNGNLASLDIKVDRPEILKQLESQLSVLKDKLSLNGIKMEQFEIKLKSQGGLNDNFAGQFENFQGQAKQRQNRQEFLKSYQYLAKSQNLTKSQNKLARQVRYDELESLV